MGIFDKIKSILSDLENSDASSGKPSGANPTTPAIPTTPVPPVETRNEATVKPSETPVPPPDNAPGAAPSGAPSSAVSPMMGLGMTGRATATDPATASAFVMPNRDDYESTETYLEAVKKATAEAYKQEALSTNRQAKSFMGTGIIGGTPDAVQPGEGPFGAVPGGNQPAMGASDAVTGSVQPATAFRSMGTGFMESPYIGIGALGSDVMGRDTMRILVAGRLGLVNVNPWEHSLRSNIFTPEITVEEQVLIDDEELKITLLEYVIDSKNDDFIKIKIENMAEKIATIVIANLTVNGYLSSAGGGWNIPPMSVQKESFESIPLSAWKLETAGMNAIGRIDFKLSVVLMSGAGEVRKIEKDITIRTSACNQTDTEIKDPGTMLLDRDGLRVFGKYVEAGFRPSRYVILYSEYNFDTTESTEIRASVPNTNFGKHRDAAVLKNGQKTLNILPVRLKPPADTIEVTLSVLSATQRTKIEETFRLTVS